MKVHSRMRGSEPIPPNRLDCRHRSVPPDWPTRYELISSRAWRWRRTGEVPRAHIHHDLRRAIVVTRFVQVILSNSVAVGRSVPTITRCGRMEVDRWPAFLQEFGIGEHVFELQRAALPPPASAAPTASRTLSGGAPGHVSFGPPPCYSSCCSRRASNRPKTLPQIGRASPPSGGRCPPRSTATARCCTPTSWHWVVKRRRPRVEIALTTASRARLREWACHPA